MGDSYGANVTLVASSVTSIAGMTIPTGWALTVAANSTYMSVSLIFNMGSTAMNLAAFAHINFEKMTYT